MPFNIFNLLVKCVTILFLSGHCSSHRPRQFPHTLNKVSNFDGTFEKDYRDISEQPYSEENYLPKNPSNKNNLLEDNIGIGNVNLSVKHDPEKEQGLPGSRKVDRSEERDELKPHILRVVQPLSGQEKCNTSNSKNCFNDLPSYLVKIDNGGQKDRKVPEYDDDCTKTPVDRSCKNYERVDGLCPVPLLASMLITKLMQPKNGSKLDALKCNLDNPEIQQYRKNYMQRKKRQLEYLKGRGTKRKKLKTNRKNRLNYRNINETGHTQITNVAEHTSTNWTSNKTAIFTPLYFGTISPVAGRLVTTNIKDKTSSEERTLLKKISSRKPGNRITASTPSPPNVQFSRTEFLPNGTYPRSPSNGTLSSLDQSPQEIQTNAQPPEMTPSVQHDPQKLKTDFYSKINDPKFRKILLEIMQRQQKMASFENLLQATTKMYKPSVANQRTPPVPTANTTSLAPNSPAPPAENTTPDIANTDNSSYTKSNFWGLIVPSPTHEAEIKMNKSTKRSEKPEEITEPLHDFSADSIQVGVSAKDDIQPVATQLSTTQNFPNSSAFVSDRNHVTQIESSPEIKEKLNKLQKDLKMVQEIQGIFNEVAGMREQHRKKKSSNGSKNEGNEKKQSGHEDNAKQYDDVISAIIKTRIWNETKNKGFSSAKTIKRENTKVPSSAEHFFGRSYQNLQNNISVARDKGWKIKREDSNYVTQPKDDPELEFRLLNYTLEGSELMPQMVEQHTTLSTRQNLLEAKKIISNEIIPFKKAKLFSIEDELLTEKSFLTQTTTNSDEDYQERFTSSNDINDQDDDDGGDYVAGDEVPRDDVVNAASAINAANSFTNDDDLSSDLVVVSDEFMKGSDEAAAKNILENINKEGRNVPGTQSILTPKLDETESDLLPRRQKGPTQFEASGPIEANIAAVISEIRTASSIVITHEFCKGDEDDVATKKSTASQHTVSKTSGSASTQVTKSTALSGSEESSSLAGHKLSQFPLSTQAGQNTIIESEIIKLFSTCKEEITSESGIHIPEENEILTSYEGESSGELTRTVSNENKMISKEEHARAFENYYETEASEPETSEIGEATTHDGELINEKSEETTESKSSTAEAEVHSEERTFDFVSSFESKAESGKLAEIQGSGHSSEKTIYVKCTDPTLEPSIEATNTAETAETNESRYSSTEAESHSTTQNSEPMPAAKSKNSNENRAIAESQNAYSEAEKSDNQYFTEETASSTETTSAYSTFQESTSGARLQKTPTSSREETKVKYTTSISLTESRATEHTSKTTWSRASSTGAEIRSVAGTPEGLSNSESPTESNHGNHTKGEEGAVSTSQGATLSKLQMTDIESTLTVETVKTAVRSGTHSTESTIKELMSSIESEVTTEPETHIESKRTEVEGIEVVHSESVVDMVNLTTVGNIVDGTESPNTDSNELGIIPKATKVMEYAWTTGTHQFKRILEEHNIVNENDEVIGVTNTSRVIYASGGHHSKILERTDTTNEGAPEASDKIWTEITTKSTSNGTIDHDVSEESQGRYKMKVNKEQREEIISIKSVMSTLTKTRAHEKPETTLNTSISEPSSQLSEPDISQRNVVESASFAGKHLGTSLNNKTVKFNGTGSEGAITHSESISMETEHS